MTEIDILADLRAWRDGFAREHGYDLGAIGAALRAMDAAAGSRVVRGEPRKPVATALQVSTPSQPPQKATPSSGRGQFVPLND